MNNNFNLVKGDKVGIVKRIFDYFIIAEGLDTAFIGEVVCFRYKNSSIKGQILNLEKKEVKIALLKGDQSQIQINDVIYRTHKTIEVTVGMSVLGRVTSPLGETLNASEFSRHEYIYKNAVNRKLFSIERDAATIIERETVRKPFMTGINAVDFFTPVGCGQRELVIGDNNTGKTSLCVTVIMNQCYWNNVVNGVWRKLEDKLRTEAHQSLVPCIYVWVGARRSEAMRLKNLLKVSKALSFTAIIFTAADEPAALQYIAPYSGVSIGEWFRDKGHNALVIFDDLSQQAVAYRQMSLILRRPPGREAYPGDIFYIHSRLLERAGQLNKNKGGGSVTALPVVETKAGDISSYIPTNVISITDGQVFLSLELINKGQRPAISLGLSVSRVGSSAQYPAITDLAKKLKLDYALYLTYGSVSKVGGAVDETIERYISRGEKIMMLFVQKNYHSYSLYEQVVFMFSLVNGYVDRLESKYLKLYFSLMLNKYISSQYMKPEWAHLLVSRSLIESMFRSEKIDMFEDSLHEWNTAFNKFWNRTIYPKLSNDKDDKFFKILQAEFL